LAMFVEFPPVLSAISFSTFGHLYLTHDAYNSSLTQSWMTSPAWLDAPEPASMWWRQTR
jgi:hypothetical protein